MKKLFNKAKLDFKFSRAGPGHALGEEKPLPKPSPSTDLSAPRLPPSSSAQSAGSAAIARVEGKEVPQASRKTRTAAQGPPPKSQKQFLGATASAHSDPQPVVVDVASSSIVVHVICPVCQRSVPSSSYQQHLTGCLQEEYLKEPLSSSVQMIHSLCRDQEKKKNCIEILCRYLDNVIEHPGEEKYCKIRTNNKAFQERVCPVQGATLFLEAVGFSQQLLPHQDGEEQFYVLSEETAQSVDVLRVHKELLTSTKPLSANVDRCLQVFRPSPRATHFDLPNEFFHLSLDEIRREQRLRTEVAEHESILRTKAMRERDEIRMVVKHYRFTLIRIRMPNGLLLQGVFRPLEKLSAVRLLVSEALADPSLVFSLSAMGKPLLEDDHNLAQLGLVPSSIVNLSFEVGRSPSSSLKSELLARIQEL